ncbi:MAG: phage terminase large subunit [Candidatus Desulfaltia sp.]|nr:phage terminase large subunit [Candidatus Desulfaltia sp.]
MSQKPPKQLKFELSTIQTAYANSSAMVNVIYSSRGEGKSFVSIVSMLVHAQRNQKPIRCAIIRDTHENIKISVVRAIQEIFPPSLYTFKNDFKQLVIKSEPHVFVDLFGIDDLAALQKLQGPEYSLVWLEEPAPMSDKANAGLSEDVFNAALIVCARQKDTIPRLQISMNPADQDHWTYRRFFEEPDVDPGNPLITKAVFAIPYRDNPHLTEQARQAVKIAYKNDPASYARYVENKFVAITKGKKVTPDYGTGAYTSDRPLEPAMGLEGFRAYDGWFNPTPYDKETEVLTLKGWKYIPDIELGELVMTLNPETQEMGYQPVLNKFHRKYTGDMYYWKGQNYNLRVTDYHSIPRLKSGQIISKPAKDLGVRTTMLNSGIWTGIQVDNFILPRHDNPPCHIEPVKIPMDVFAEFMGIYLSEGSSSTYKAYKTDEKPCHYDTVIYQKERKKEIEDVLNRMPFKWTWFENSRGNGWKAHSVQLYKYLVGFGLSHQKFIPEEIKMLPSEQLRLFLKMYLIGDGSEGRTISTSSKTMANDLQEIILKAGWSAAIGILDNIGRKFNVRGKTYTTRHLSYRVYISFVKTTNLVRKNLKIEKVENEDVYCIEAPNHIIYVRRKGKARWCGNCILGQITHTGRLIFIDTVKGDNIDIRTLIDQKIQPMLNSPRWKGKCKSWRDIGDRSMKIPDQSNINESAARVIEKAFGTYFEGGPARWTHMKMGIDHIFKMNIAGKPAFIVNKNNRLLDKALSGAWSYKVDSSGNIMGDIPQKSELSHVGDAWANAVNVLLPSRTKAMNRAVIVQMQQKGRARASSYAV